MTTNGNDKTYIENLLEANIAIIGGGRFCKIFLEYLYDPNFLDRSPNLLGVADTNRQAEGVRLARDMGVYTTTDYRKLFELDGLQVLIELTDDARLWDRIKKSKPPDVTLIDHTEARAVWSSLQLEREKRRALRRLRKKESVSEEILQQFVQFGDRLAELMRRRNQRYLEIEKGLVKSERTLEQIIQGSTIPTFVIDNNHCVTHWNKAMERLTGVPADAVIGTNRQWSPFWENERPSMADVILDQIGEEEIKKLYGTQWRRSALIEGGYEAEMFFPNLGKQGRWCWFTAAPIKAPDESIIGAIETVWDKTEDKKAEQERERHMRLLTESARALAESERTMNQIIQGSTMPTFVINEKHIIIHWNKALERLTGIEADRVSGTNRQWLPFYEKPRPTMADVVLDQIRLSSKMLTKPRGFSRLWGKTANGAGLPRPPSVRPAAGSLEPSRPSGTRPKTKRPKRSASSAPGSLAPCVRYIRR